MRDFQRRVDAQFKQYGWEYWPPLEQLARLTEETGEVAREMNAQFGHKSKKASEDPHDLAEEIADVIFTCFCIANALGIDLDEAMETVIAKGPERNKDRK